MSRQMAFPVRFVSEGQTVQTTSRELDLEGVFVRCVEPPEQGERVVLRLYLPGIAAGDSIEATVAETDGEGFRALFVELSEEALQHIRAALDAGEEAQAAEVEPTIAHSSDHRRYLRRYLDRFRVTLGGDESREVTNLSGSGLFIETRRPPDLDQIVHLILELPDGREPAQVQGIVMRRVMPETGERAGAGVQFISGDDDFRERLDAYLETRRG
jgi:Tfp pilus assembly protein PilZ